MRRADDDTVELLAGALVEGSVSACLGDGNNQLLVNVAEEDATDDGAVETTQNEDAVLEEAIIEGNLSFRGGDGDDSVEIGEAATVGGNACLELGGGDNNTVTHLGEIEGNLSVRGKDGDDSVEIGEDSTVGGDARLELGGGDNTVTHLGDIEGNLLVCSANEDDAERVNVDEDNVGGQTKISLGEQCGRGWCGRGWHGHGGFGGGMFGCQPGGKDWSGGQFEQAHQQKEDWSGGQWPTSVGWDGAGQGEASLTYYVKNAPDELDLAEVESAIESALDAWAKVADITFTEALAQSDVKAILALYAPADSTTTTPSDPSTPSTPSAPSDSDPGTLPSNNHGFQPTPSAPRSRPANPFFGYRTPRGFGGLGTLGPVR